MKTKEVITNYASCTFDLLTCQALTHLMHELGQEGEGWRLVIVPIEVSDTTVEALLLIG